MFLSLDQSAVLMVKAKQSIINKSDCDKVNYCWDVNIEYLMCFFVYNQDWLFFVL